MVKVISAYNFQEQNTYSTNGDITASCLIDSNQLAIAHNNHLIEILTLNRKKKATASDIYFDQNENSRAPKITFPTVDQVQQLLYCSTGNFLLTLERKFEQTNESSRRFVRVYKNFQNANSECCFSIPIRARIASKVTPRSCTNDYIEVIELPVNDVPDIVACCQMSGAIAVGCTSNIYFYEFVNRSNDSYKFTFIDFCEFPFYIQLEFIPTKLAIAEHVVTCLNENHVVAFKIVDLNDISLESGSTSSNSMLTDSSLHTTTHKLTEPVDYEVAKQFNQVNGQELETDIRSIWDSSSVDYKLNYSEERPVSVNDIKVYLRSTDDSNSKDRGFYAARTLLQLRMPQGKNACVLNDQFRCLTLKAIYHNSDESISTDIASQKHLMKSDCHYQCVGFSLFISTVSDGYLYQFTNQGKWYSENTKCLAVYPFTAPVINVIVDNYVIHAVTENGIETFSSRVGHKLFSSYYEYPMMCNRYPKETSPLVDVPICVMGICVFFGVKFVAASSKNIVLLTTYNGKKSANCRNQNEKFEVDWTIYDLQLAKPEILVNDIKNLANMYSNTKPDMYYELMEEAHIITRLARELKNDHDENIKDIVESTFIETCQQLADFTITSDRKEIYSQAVAYYVMCKQPVWEVYLRHKQLCDTQQQNNYDGLIYSLKVMLSQLSTNKNDSECLTQIIRSQCLNDKDVNEFTVAEELLNLFITHAPNEIAAVGLQSLVFREILNEQLIKFLMGKEKLRSDEKMCLVACLCHSNDMKEALKVFETMSRKELFLTLKEYWIILFDNFQMDNYRKAYFSDLAENVFFVTEQIDSIEALSDVLIHILIESHYIDLDFILKLFMNYFVVRLGQKGYRTSQKILEILLRTYFYDFYNFNNRNVVKNIDVNSENSLSHENASNLRISDDLLTATTTTTSSNYDDPEFEAMKILFRLYLGLLKQYSANDRVAQTQQNDSILPDVMGFRLAFIDYIVHNTKIIKTAHCKFDNSTFNVDVMNLLPNYTQMNDEELKTFRRPIVFFERREMFLNKMKPFTENSFKADYDNVLYFDDWDNEVNLVLLKIQALLNSGKLDNQLIDDFIAFIHSNPNVIGIDSLIAILLPKSEGVEFLVHVNPSYLLDYAKSRFSTPNQWQVLFRRLLAKKREQNPTLKHECIEYYDKIIRNILRDLVADKNLEDFLACIPEQEIYPIDENHESRNNKNSADTEISQTQTPDTVDESNPFEVIMREVVAKQRSDALCTMIKSTGRQLYDAVTNRQLYLN